MLERDNVVIGAGLSGLAAAMRLNGSTLLLSYGIGSYGNIDGCSFLSCIAGYGGREMALKHAVA